MKILIFSLNYAPEPTGTGKYTGEMAAWLAGQGHKVEVICGLPHYPQWRLYDAYRHGRIRREVHEGVSVKRTPHFIPQADNLNAKTRIWMELSFTMSAARHWIPRVFSRSKPDIVIAVMPPMQIAAWPLLYSLVRRVPCVLQVQDLQVDAALRLGLLKSRGGRLLYGIEGLLLRMATRVATITEAMRQRIVEKGVKRDKTLLFPNWADVENVTPRNRDNGFRRVAGVEPHQVIVLYAGNMGEKQGLSSVLEAAALFRGDSDIVFLMVGTGAARVRLELLAKDLALPNLRFLDVQPLEMLPDMLAAGDIHLIVQRRDAADLVMPSKLTNILAAGRACVATADPGTALHEVVCGHDTGEVVPPGDHIALAGAIRRMVSDPHRRVACGQRARRYAELYLDRNRILGLFEDSLRSLCKREMV